MYINVLFPNLSRKPSGGHKVLYEYCNLFAYDGNSVSIYYYPAELFTSYHASELIRVPMVKIYAFLFGTCCWFPLNKSIKARVIDHASDMRRADVVIATGVSGAEPVSNLSEKYGKKVYFIQDFENWQNTDAYVEKTYQLGMKIFVVSNWLKNIVDKYSKAESTLISNGIDNRVFFDRGGIELHTP